MAFPQVTGVRLVCRGKEPEERRAGVRTGDGGRVGDTLTSRMVEPVPDRSRCPGASVCRTRRGCRSRPFRAPDVQLTDTADQAAATALYSVLPAPYRSFAALSVAVRAPA